MSPWQQAGEAGHGNLCVCGEEEKDIIKHTLALH